MHALHAILIKFEEEELKETNTTELAEIARETAMDATSCYYQQAYDWRTEEDVGRWADEFPGNGVVLGIEEPERLLQLLKTYSEMPLKNAKEKLEFLQYKQLSWRTKEAIEKEKLEILSNSRNGKFKDQEGNPLYWSGKRLPEIVFNEDFINKVWKKDTFDSLTPWTLLQIVKLIVGEYTFSSHFYSIPDYSSKISPETMSDVQENPEYFALVFSDYHF